MINSENYFSPENRQKYMSVSLFKAFKGTFHKAGCEAEGMAIFKGETQRELTQSILIGSYVDAYFEGSLDKFLSRPENKLTPANLEKAKNAIKTAESDPLYMKFMSGQKQAVFTAELFGIEWKIKIDSLLENAIVDQKVMACIHSKNWSEKEKRYVNFIDYWGYDIQMAVYQEIYFRNTGNRVPCFIAPLTSEKVPDKAIIEISQESMNSALNYVKQHIETIKFLIEGNGNPVRCEECDYCKSTKVLQEPIWDYELSF
jgi:hypothetical protein